MKVFMAASLQFIVIRNQNAPKAKQDRRLAPTVDCGCEEGSFGAKKDGTNGYLFVPGGQ
jgi:hypothetical protein